ncbi:hypothetical protein ACFDTO_07135 [Microbacteriaceae bacterium 4G12]
MEIGLRTATNLVRSSGDDAAIDLVVIGPAVVYLVTKSGYDRRVAELSAEGGTTVQIIGCRNSMRSAGVRSTELVVGVRTTAYGVAYLSERQWEGWAYLRL